jgi:hypothetical protein
MRTRGQGYGQPHRQSLLGLRPLRRWPHYGSSSARTPRLQRHHRMLERDGVDVVDAVDNANNLRSVLDLKSDAVVTYTGNPEVASVGETFAQIVTSCPSSMEWW